MRFIKKKNQCCRKGAETWPRRLSPVFTADRFGHRETSTDAKARGHFAKNKHATRPQSSPQIQQPHIFNHQSGISENQRCHLIRSSFTNKNIKIFFLLGGAKVKSQADSKEYLQTTGASSSPNNDLNNFDSPLCRPDECATPQLPPPPAESADIELSTRVPESTASGAGNYTSVTVHQQITPRCSDPITVVNSKGSTGGGGGGDTKITVDVVVDFKGIRICDHHHNKETD